MVFNEKEYDIYIDQKVKNLISDEAAHIIDTKQAFSSYPHAYAILLEEVEEVTEEVEQLNAELKMLWGFIRTDEIDGMMIEQLKTIKQVAENIIHEAKQVGAVAKKAIEQVGDDCGKKGKTLDTRGK